MRGGLVLLACALLAGEAQASWNVDSSDTGPGNLVVYNDYWNAGRVTLGGDAPRIDLTIQTDEAGPYRWQILDEVSGQANPLRLLYSGIDVRLGEALLGSLAPGDPLDVDLTTAPTRFGLTFHVRALDNETASSFWERDDAGDLLVAGWLSLQQLAPDAPGDGTTVTIVEALHLGIAHRFNASDGAGGGRGEVVLHDAIRVAAPVERPPGDLPETWFTIGEADLGVERHYDMCISGDLLGRSITWYADGKPLTMLVPSAGGIPVAKAARTLPGQECVRLILPPGKYQLQMMVNEEVDAMDGAYALSHVSRQEQLTGAIRVTPERFPWPWAAAGIAGVLVSALLAWIALRPRFKLIEAVHQGNRTWMCVSGDRVVATLRRGRMEKVAGPAPSSAPAGRTASCKQCPARRMCWDDRKRAKAEAQG